MRMETATTQESHATTTTPQPSHPAARSGLLVGGALLAVETIHGVVSVYNPPLAVTAIFFLVAIGGLLLAGYLAARTSGRVSGGALAGLIAGALLGVGYALGTTLGAALDFAAVSAVYRSAAAASHVAYTDQLTIIGTIVTVALAFLVSLGVGAACGAVGGLVAKSRIRNA